MPNRQGAPSTSDSWTSKSQGSRTKVALEEAELEAAKLKAAKEADQERETFEDVITRKGRVTIDTAHAILCKGEGTVGGIALLSPSNGRADQWDRSLRNLLDAKQLPRPGGGKPIWTLNKQAVLRLRDEKIASVKAALAMRRDGWNTFNDTAAKAKRPGRVVAPILKRMQATGPEFAQELDWPVALKRATANKQAQWRFRKLWVYKWDRFEELFSGKETPPGSAIVDHAERDKSCSPSDPEIDSGKKGGRTRDPATQAFYKACYDAYMTATKLVTAIGEVEQHYPERAPITTSHLRLFAQRHAQRNKLPAHRTPNKRQTP
jgi:hypothetical protein